MKAAVYRGPYRILVENVPEPEVKGNKVAVDFKAGSICGTDLHLYRGEWKIKRGRIIGHDAWGIRKDTRERVVLMPVTFCGKCYFCLRGLPTYCERSGNFFGLNLNGFFAEHLAMRPRYLLPLPDEVDEDEAAVLEPVALALHVLDLVKPNIGDYVAIIGQGPIGLLMTQVAKLKGCRVIAVDLEAYRLKFSEKYGADYVINAGEEDSVKRVKEITGRGSDVVIEAAGTRKTVEQTAYQVRKAGKVALVGEFQGYLNLEEADGACFFTTYISPVQYPTALRLMAEKKIDVKSLITHRFRLEEFEKAIQTADNHAEEPLKVIIKS